MNYVAYFETPTGICWIPIQAVDKKSAIKKANDIAYELYMDMRKHCKKRTTYVNLVNVRCL